MVINMINFIFYISLIVFIVLLFLNIKNKTYFNPVFLFCMPLNLQYILYYLIYSKDHIISNTTLFVIILGQVAFLLGYILVKILPKKKISQSYKVYEKYNWKIINFFLIIGIVCMLLSIIYMSRLNVSNFNFNSTGANLREAFVHSINSTPFYVIYGKYFLLFSSITIWYAYLTHSIKIKKKYMICLLILVIINSFIVLSRTDFLITVVPILAVFYQTIRIKSNVAMNNQLQTGFLKKRYKLLLFTVILFAFYVLNSRRMIDDGTMNTIQNNVIIQYIGKPLIVLDQWIIPNPGVAHGYLFFELFNKIGAILGANFYYGIELAPLGTFNVYSYLFVPYIEYGVLGVIVLMFLIGIVSTMLYEKFLIGKNKSWVIFYSFYSYSLIIAFFDWQFGIMTYVYLAVYLSLISIKWGDNN